MYKYYKVVGTEDGLSDVILYGSYSKDDCKFEIDAEKNQWYDEGFHNIRIEFDKTQIPPDSSIYGKDFKPDLV